MTLHHTFHIVSNDEKSKQTGYEFYHHDLSSVWNCMTISKGMPSSSSHIGTKGTIVLTVLHTLMLYEDRVLKRICGPKRDEVTGDWKQLHDKEHHNL